MNITNRHSNNIIIPRKKIKSNTNKNTQSKNNNNNNNNSLNNRANKNKPCNVLNSNGSKRELSLASISPITSRVKNLYFVYFLSILLLLLIIILICIIYYHNNNNNNNPLVYNITCHNDSQFYLDCSPSQCKRIIYSQFLNSADTAELRSIIERVLVYGRSDGGASIFDMHTGALSKGNAFINFKHLNKRLLILNDSDFIFYDSIKNRVHSLIADCFSISKQSLYLTSPTFFSEMTAKPAQTIHDQYWHKHVDKETYGAFEYTVLIYLSDYNVEFTGGRFIFYANGRESEIIIEPRQGLLSLFTSGSENPHRVEQVRSGVRYAMTLGFTCDASKQINSPSL